MTSGQTRSRWLLVTVALALLGGQVAAMPSQSSLAVQQCCAEPEYQSASGTDEQHCLVADRHAACTPCGHCATALLLAHARLEAPTPVSLPVRSAPPDPASPSIFHPPRLA